MNICQFDDAYSNLGCKISNIFSIYGLFGNKKKVNSNDGVELTLLLGRMAVFLQRIILEGVEHSAEITLTGVGQQDDNPLAFVLRAKGYL